MSCFDMTDQEVEMASRFGFCEFCGAARTVRAHRVEAEPGVFEIVLTCSRCDREVSEA